MEEWKPTEKGYFVSSSGQIKNASGKILRQYKNKSGYMLIRLAKMEFHTHIKSIDLLQKHLFLIQIIMNALIIKIQSVMITIQIIWNG